MNNFENFDTFNLLDEIESVLKDLTPLELNQIFGSEYHTIGQVVQHDTQYYIYDGSDFLTLNNFMKMYGFEKVREQDKDKIYDRVAMWL